MNAPSRLLQFEVFATVPGDAAAVWALVSDPARLPEWTDAEDVPEAPAPPLALGSRFATVDGDRRLEWVVITSEPYLLEAKTDQSACGRLGFGVRVSDDPHGTRLVLAGLLDPAVLGLRARMVDVPRLRARLDRWADAAARVVSDA